MYLAINKVQQQYKQLCLIKIYGYNMKHIAIKIQEEKYETKEKMVGKTRA